MSTRASLRETAMIRLLPHIFLAAAEHATLAYELPCSILWPWAATFITRQVGWFDLEVQPALIINIHCRYSSSIRWLSLQRRCKSSIRCSRPARLSGDAVTLACWTAD